MENWWVSYRASFVIVRNRSVVKHLQWLWTITARFIGPTWGPSGADRTQVGPILAPWTWLSGKVANHSSYRSCRRSDSMLQWPFIYSEGPMLLSGSWYLAFFVMLYYYDMVSYNHSIAYSSGEVFGVSISRYNLCSALRIPMLFDMIYGEELCYYIPKCT